MAEAIIHEGTTDETEWQIQSDGTAFGLGTVDHVEALLYDAQNRLLKTYKTTDAGARLTISNAAQGKVKLKADQLVTAQSPYKGFFKVYQTATSWFGAPEPDRFFTIIVLP